jgi:hypothetical protein
MVTNAQEAASGWTRRRHGKSSTRGSALFVSGLKIIMYPRKSVLGRDVHKPLCYVWSRWSGVALSIASLVSCTPVCCGVVTTYNRMDTVPCQGRATPDRLNGGGAPHASGFQEAPAALDRWYFLGDGRGRGQPYTSRRLAHHATSRCIHWVRDDASPGHEPDG